MGLVIAAEIAAAAFAALAAILWHTSAVVKLPDLTLRTPPSGGVPDQVRALSKAYYARLFTEDLDKLTCALRLQSRYSKWAAFYAGLAAALQAIVIVLQM